VKAFYAVVFVLFSFAASAQTLETWIAAYYLDDLDCFGETTQNSAMPPQIIETAIINNADGVASTGSDGIEDVPVGAIQPGYDSATEKYLTGGDDDLTGNDTIEQDATSAQIIATKPTIETPGDAKLNEADEVAFTGPNDAEDVPVGTILPGDENSAAEYSTLRGDKLTADDRADQGRMPDQIIPTEPASETLAE
jgi:hypothetical protein